MIPVFYHVRRITNGTRYVFFCEAHCLKGVRDSVRAEYKNHRACIQSRTKPFTVMFRRSLFRFYKYPLKSLNY